MTQRSHSQSDIVGNEVKPHKPKRSLSDIPPPAHAKLSSHGSNTNRCVKFGQAVNVVLIPTREEYRTASLDNGLWWRKCELKSFKENAVEELMIAMIDLKMDLPHARTILYQPRSTLIDQWKKSYGRSSVAATSEAAATIASSQISLSENLSQ